MTTTTPSIERLDELYDILKEMSEAGFILDHEDAAITKRMVEFASKNYPGTLTVGNRCLAIVPIPQKPIFQHVEVSGHLEELKLFVRKIFEEQLGLPKGSLSSLDDMTTVRALGADSLDEVELVMAIEDEFGVEIVDEEAEGLQTLNDVCDYLIRVRAHFPVWSSERLNR